MTATHLDYWNRDEVESMYDKHLLNAEIDLIRRHIAPGAKVLDAGCGEGEGTEAYASLPEVRVHAADFSETRLAKAQERLSGRQNITFKKVDFTNPAGLDDDYDAVVSQRFLINLTDWALQRQVITDLYGRIKPGGTLVLLEGSIQGTDSLNALRRLFDLPPIPPKWHNLFFDDGAIEAFLRGLGANLEPTVGLGTYFALTRGIRPSLVENLNWDCQFNRVAATAELDGVLGLGTRCSRLKLWVSKKP